VYRRNDRGATGAAPRPRGLPNPHRSGYAGEEMKLSR
jgi:hypothetical protein